MEGKVHFFMRGPAGLEEDVKSAVQGKKTDISNYISHLHGWYSAGALLPRRVRVGDRVISSYALI